MYLSQFAKRSRRGGVSLRVGRVVRLTDSSILQPTHVQSLEVSVFRSFQLFLLHLDNIWASSLLY